VTGELILVVDDGQENREFIIDYVLTPHEYRHLAARDGLEALEMIMREPPDLILLDYQMPRMNGAELLAELQQRNINIPVVLMTFYGSEEVAVEVYRLGVRDYVKKPFSIDEMLMAIARSLSDARLRREKEALTERLIAANRELIHKIGVTGLDVERRLANARLDPTFLLAEVEVVATYELYNIHRSKLENLIHRIFAPARLEITIKDRFGNPVVPREWFLVPLHVIDQAVEKIRDGSITRYGYDPASAALVERGGDPRAAGGGQMAAESGKREV